MEGGSHENIQAEIHPSTSQSNLIQEHQPHGEDDNIDISVVPASLQHEQHSNEAIEEEEKEHAKKMKDITGISAVELRRRFLAQLEIMEKQASNMLRSGCLSLFLSIVFTPILGLFFAFCLMSGHFSVAGLIGANSLVWLLWGIPFIVVGSLYIASCPTPYSMSCGDNCPLSRFGLALDTCNVFARAMLVGGCFFTLVGVILAIYAGFRIHREEEEAKGTKLVD